MSLLITGGAIVLGLSVIGILIVLIVRTVGFNKQIRINKVIQGGSILVIDDLAKEVTDPKDLSKYWMTKKTKIKIPLPPEYVISLTPKGRQSVECYILSGGITQWATPLKDMQKVNWENPNRIIEGKEPLTTEQRQLIANEYYKALEKKGKSMWDMIAHLAPLLICAIVVIFLMVFYEDMGKPLLEMADKQIEWNAMQTEQLKILEQMQRDIQVIGGEKLQQVKANVTQLSFLLFGLAIPIRRKYINNKY